MLRNKGEATKILEKYKGFKGILQSEYEAEFNHD